MRNLIYPIQSVSFPWQECDMADSEKIQKWQPADRCFIHALQRLCLKLIFPRTDLREAEMSACKFESVLGNSKK